MRRHKDLFGKIVSFQNLLLAAKLAERGKRFKRAAKEEVVITRHGKPAGVLIGFHSEDDWFEFRLENDPRFLARIERARRHLQAGKGTPIEKIDL